MPTWEGMLLLNTLLWFNAQILNAGRKVEGCQESANVHKTVAIMLYTFH